MAQAFLIRHNSLWAACVGELVHSLDHPALVAETVAWVPRNSVRLESRIGL